MNRAIHSLQASSEIYYERADIYEDLCAAEDFDGLVFKALLPLIEGRRLLDVGCGSGKYARLLAPFAARLTGLDAAPAQLAIAQKKVAAMEPGERSRVDLVLGDALDAELAHAPYDVAIACWMLGTVLDPAKRLAILERIDGELAPGGQIILVENDSEGPFELMRGRCDASRAYNLWLRDTAGFSVHAKIPSRFLFPSATDAARVMGAIWGPKVAHQVQSPEIGHRIVMFRRDKLRAPASDPFAKNHLAR